MSTSSVISSLLLAVDSAVGSTCSGVFKVSKSLALCYSRYQEFWSGPLETEIPSAQIKSPVCNLFIFKKNLKDK